MVKGQLLIADGEVRHLRGISAGDVVGEVFESGITISHGNFRSEGHALAGENSVIEIYALTFIAFAGFLQAEYHAYLCA